MLAEERLAVVLDRINTAGKVSASALAAEFGTSEDTIRRDLRDLAAQGLCRRVYGGALRNAPVAESPAVRAGRDGARKRALGEALAGLVAPGRLVFFDAGTTTLAAARALPPSLRVTAATHDPAIAAVLAGRPGTEVILVGGRIDPAVGAALGTEAARAVSGLRPDLLLLGACAIEAEAGLTAFHAEDAALKRLLVERAGTVATAVLTGKIGEVAPFGVAPADTLGACIVEADAPEAALAPLRARGLRLARAGTASADLTGPPPRGAPRSG